MFDQYLIQFLSNNPNRIKDVAEAIYSMPQDSYFGIIGELAKANHIDLYSADIEIWKALIEIADGTMH